MKNRTKLAVFATVCIAGLVGLWITFRPVPLQIEQFGKTWTFTRDCENLGDASYSSNPLVVTCWICDDDPDQRLLLFSETDFDIATVAVEQRKIGDKWVRHGWLHETYDTQPAGESLREYYCGELRQ